MGPPPKLPPEIYSVGGGAGLEDQDQLSGRPPLRKECHRPADPAAVSQSVSEHNQELSVCLARKATRQGETWSLQTRNS